MITANSGHDLVPSRIYQFAGWTGDGYIDLLCAVICSGLADHIQPYCRRGHVKYLMTTSEYRAVLTA